LKIPASPFLTFYLKTANCGTAMPPKGYQLRCSSITDRRKAFIALRDVKW
jgi:hypothetical protein